MADFGSAIAAMEAAKGGYRGVIAKRAVPDDPAARAAKIAKKAQTNSYLAKYLSADEKAALPGLKPGADGSSGGGEKKKRKKLVADGSGGDVKRVAPTVRIVDVDYDWKRDAIPNLEAEGEDAPVLVKPTERKRLKDDDDDADDNSYDALANVKFTVQDGSGWEDKGTAATAVAASKRLASPDQSPPRKKRLSSPESNAAGAGAGASAGAADLSPPRRKRVASPDLSPARKPVASAASNDLSPPRRKRVASPDLSPGRKPAAASSSAADLSPPRKPTISSSSSSSNRRSRSRTPPRRRVASPDQSPPRKSAHSSSAADLSPPRKPASNSATGSSSGTANSSAAASASGAAPKTGLRTGRDFAAEAAETERKKRAALYSMSAEQSGANAATVVRDKRGRKLTPEELAAKQAAASKQEDDLKAMEWGKGLVQGQQARAKRADDAHEAAKPFARYKDDADLDALQRETSRWGDPLANLKRKQTDEKRKKEAALAAAAAIESAEILNASAAAAAGGAVVVADAAPKRIAAAAAEPKRVVKRLPRPRYTGAPWHNRFGIAPGYRWDGVVRGINWEDRLAMGGNRKKLVEEQAYKWSTEDM